MVDFLENPLVEYIPIGVNNSREGTWQNSLYIDSDLYIYQEHKGLLANLSQLGLPQINYDSDNNMAIIALNFKVEKIYYRFHTIKIIGQMEKDYYHIFSITNRYFPRRIRIIHFALFTQEGEKIAWKNIKIL